MHKNVGIIGLGIMGYHIASHLIKKKSIHILERESKKTQDFIKRFGKNKNFTLHRKLNEISNNCSFIITCVGDDNDLNQIFLVKIVFSKALKTL